MPGLAGIIQLAPGEIEPAVFNAMQRALLHRPWYQVEVYRSPDCRLAVARIHLGTLYPQPQPYLARQGRVKLFLYGEFYRETTLATPEWICQQYEQAGPAALTRLHGSFQLLLVDEDQQSLYLVNDRIGSRPLYYYQDQAAFYFAPEQKSLLQIPSLPRRLYLPAAADFLTNCHFTAAHTLIEGVKTLDSATLLHFQGERYTQHRYWTFTFDEEARDLGAEHYRAELSARLRQAVQRTRAVTPRYGVLLSGGYDSRAILGCCLEAQPAATLATVSWGREEALPDSDCLIARQLAETLGTQHGFYRLSGAEILADWETFIHLGEGLTDFPESYTVFDRIRAQQGLEAVLRGDECFGYSRWTTVHDELSMFRALDLRVLRYMRDLQALLQPARYREFCEMDAATRQQLSAQCPARRLHNRKDFYYLNARVKYYLNPLNYVKNFALESPRPLLDDDILELVTRLPLKYRLGKRFWRATAVQLFPQLYTALARRDNMIRWPAALRATPETESWVRQQLLDPQSFLSDWFNRPALQAYLDRFFAPRPATAAPAGSGWLQRLEAQPRLYYWLHGGVYRVKKQLERLDHTLEPERLILRLLILNSWGQYILDHGRQTTNPV